MDAVGQQLKPLLAGTDALLEAMRAIVQPEGDGPNNIWRYSGYVHFIRKYNQLAKGAREIDPSVTMLLDVFNEETILSIHDTVPSQQKQYFAAVLSNLAILKASLETRIGVKDDRAQALTDFFKANLPRAMHREPEREKDVQDAIETLLIGRNMQKGIDYDREVGAVKIAHKQSIPDFIFRNLSLALEIKLSRDVRKSKEIVDEINADVVAYGQEYSRLLFIVYDIGSIRDEQEFTQGLQSRDGVMVIVVKH